MDKTEALAQIDNISRVLKANNRVFFSGKRMIANGLLLGFIPLLEYGFSRLLGQYITNLYANNVVHVLFYWAIFKLLNVAISHYGEKKNRMANHPLIVQALRVHRPIVFAIFGIIFIFLSIAQSQLIFPMIYILLGILYSLLGCFSIKIMRYIAWSYIILGLVYAFLTQFHFQFLWIIFMSYLALSYIVMGWALLIQDA